MRWGAGGWSLAATQAAACGVGGAGLAAVCRALCIDYRHLAGGMPDLLVRRHRERKGAGGGRGRGLRAMAGVGGWKSGGSLPPFDALV